MEQGNPSAIPVVLLHGIAGSWRSFEPVLAHFPKSFHGIALTQRGHGDASHPKSGYRIHDFSSDLAEFMKAKGFLSAVIVGHSMGSAIAQQIAIDYPERTLGLVMVGAPVVRPGDPALKAFLNSTISRLTDPVDPAFVHQFAASMLVRSIQVELSETLLQDALRAPSLLGGELSRSC